MHHIGVPDHRRRQPEAGFGLASAAYRLSRHSFVPELLQRRLDQTKFNQVTTTISHAGAQRSIATRGYLQWWFLGSGFEYALGFIPLYLKTNTGFGIRPQADHQHCYRDRFAARFAETVNRTLIRSTSLVYASTGVAGRREVLISPNLTNSKARHLPGLFCALANDEFDRQVVVLPLPYCATTAL